jgi:hypothetical protein
VLDEVEARRAMLAEVIEPHVHRSTDTGRWAREALKRLGRGFQHQPGYREEWRP